MQNKLTALIGRFSIFHKGHAELLERALRKSDHVVLLVGSSGLSRNIKNPFTFEEREMVIRSWYKGLGGLFGTLHIFPLQDHPYNDQAWAEQVQAFVVGVAREYNIPANEYVLTGAERDHSGWYLKMFGNFFKLDLVVESKTGFELSATTVRNDYFNGGHIYDYKCPEITSNFLDNFRKTNEYANLVKEADFIAKYKKAWKDAPYAPTFVTVDACVVQSGHVLVVERDAFPGRGLWALPGGFLDQNEKLVDGAVRELIEETSIGLSRAQLYGSISDEKVFDHPDRSLRGRTITTCFTFKLNDSFALPSLKAQPGEIKKAFWLPLAEARAMADKWYEDHWSIMTTMVARIKN